MGQAISVRLDAEVQRALRVLEATGVSRSEAIRRAILESAATRRRRAAIRKEVLALDAEEEDRAEMRAVAAVMESLRAEG